MVMNEKNLADEEACGDERPSLQRLWREGGNQRQELHRLQGEGGQDPDHPGLDERRKLNHKPSPPAQMGPGMVQQSQAVCGECDGRGEIIPPSSRLTFLLLSIVIISIVVVVVVLSPSLQRRDLSSQQQFDITLIIKDVKS